MTATVTTLPHYFPEVFAFRVIISVLLLALLIFSACMLYKKKKVDKLQRNCLIILSSYTVLMLYYTLIGRYSQSYYRYDGDIFGTISALIKDFNMTDFTQLVINLVMMIPVSFLLMLILRCRYKTVVAFDITVLLIITIELSQFFTRAGTLQLDDILCNVIGAVVGIFVYYLMMIILARKEMKRHE